VLVTQPQKFYPSTMVTWMSLNWSFICLDFDDIISLQGSYSCHAERHAILKFVSIFLPTVRKIRIITNKPVHRGHTSGQRSLAYVNAGAHYMRQMSGLLKDKVNSLRQNALNDTPQGSTNYPSICDGYFITS